MTYANRIRALGDRTANMTAHEIAAEVGCAVKTARGICAYLQMPTRKVENPEEPDVDLLERAEVEWTRLLRGRRYNGARA